MSGQIHASHPHTGVVLLEIDNPPVNALGCAIRERFEQELDCAQSDLSQRVIVITGRDNAFCAGDDLREAQSRGDAASAGLGQFGRLLEKIEAHRVPVIAAVNGHAVGGGLELALCADIRIASENASFLAAGVNVGLIASVYRLPRLIGAGPASLMLLTGKPVKAARALDWGLVSEVNPREALMGAALELAQRIASRAPLSVEAAKRMIRRVPELTSQTWPHAAAEELRVLLKSNDHRIGVEAILARKEPVFTRS